MALVHGFRPDNKTRLCKPCQTADLLSLALSIRSDRRTQAHSCKAPYLPTHQNRNAPSGRSCR